MDILLETFDPFLDSLYGSFSKNTIDLDFSRNSPLRQSISSFLISLVGVNILYFGVSTLVYYSVFDRTIEKHPKFLKNQIRKEIWLSTTSFPVTALVTVPWFVCELQGYSKLYREFGQFGYPYEIFAFLGFLMFTDFGVYWIHRFEHHPLLYSWLHKPHHQWKVTTPFASFAFHPLDGYFQSIPCHLYVYIVPFNSYVYLAAFVVLQLWTVSIHDGIYIVDNAYLNSGAHHTIHHLEFNYNYGQYFTLWDRIGGSYKRPEWEFKNNMFFDKLAEKRGARFEKDK